jgi:small nuclear ribonucleoprotein (snRNP)-like protein
MLFYSYFKTLVGKEVQIEGRPCNTLCQQTMLTTLLEQVTVELKNDLAIAGILHSVDQYLNIKLTDTRVVNESKYPHMVSAHRPQSLRETELQTEQ